jgi:hypothetical protein
MLKNKRFFEKYRDVQPTHLSDLEQLQIHNLKEPVPKSRDSNFEVVHLHGIFQRTK